MSTTNKEIRTIPDFLATIDPVLLHQQIDGLCAAYDKLDEDLAEGVLNILGAISDLHDARYRQYSMRLRNLKNRLKLHRSFWVKQKALAETSAKAVKSVTSRLERDIKECQEVLRQYGENYCAEYGSHGKAQDGEDE